MKRFKYGLVVGKFSPLHLGHEYVIRRAEEECDAVVILSYCKPEFPGCDARTRERWLRQRFPSANTVILVLAEDDLARHPQLAERWSSLPANDAEDAVHRDFCAAICLLVLRIEVDAVYSSEDYGEGFAQSLARHYRAAGALNAPVASVVVDRARTRFPVSGTQLRGNGDLVRDWVAPEVNATWVRRVAILGGESSGKSSLASALAEKCGSRFVAEYGRELWEQKAGKLEYTDLLHIAREQVRREEELARTIRGILFCDTSPLTTLFYSLDLFGKADQALEDLSARKYDAVVLCAPDFPFQQDGTRRDEAFRQRQDSWYRREFEDRGIAYIEARGPLCERVGQVVMMLGSS